MYNISIEKKIVKEEPIAIIGIGCRFPGNVNDTADFWKLLSEGKNAITEIPKNRWSKRLFYHPDKDRQGKIYAPKGGFLEDIDKFDPEFFGISPREAAFIDPQQRLLLEITWEALEDAGINPKSLAGSKTGVFVGLFMHDYENIHSRPSERKLKGPHSATGTSTTLASNRISYLYDFRGPSIVVDTACSSSLISIHLACQSLRNNEADISIAGGVNVLLNPETTISLCKASMLSPDGYCKAFDVRANGYTRAEGAGMIVLKPLSKAVKDNDQIYAVIRSSFMNQDGRSEGQTVPSKEAQEIALKEALKRAELKPEDIQYVEAHGTGTAVGDPIEANAIGTVLSKGRNDNNPCIMGSVKTNIGHTESAAGVAGVIKIALMFKHKQIPPNLHFETPNPKINFKDLRLRIPTSLEVWETEQDKPQIAGVNSFGFGGSNAHIILEGYIDKNNKGKNGVKQKHKKVLIPLSGHTEQALKGVAQSYLDFLNADENKDVQLEELGYTSALRKGEHNYRLTIVAETKDEFKEKVKAYIEGEKRIGMASANVTQDDSKKIVFVFSGMGQQWWAMGRQLLEEEPEVKKTIEKCDELFRTHTDEWSLLEELKKNEENSRINETRIAQPAIFSLQIALFELWRSRGIIPDAIVGHSVGEVAAAYAAGILSLEDSVRVCYNRSRLQQKTAGSGKMLAVGLSAEKIEEIVELYKNTVSVAAINSPRSVTISGDAESLKDIADVLEEKDIFVRFLRVEVPYHSPIMDTILPEFKESLKSIKPNRGNTPLVSTVTGKFIDGEKMDNKYWCKNVREPVYFNKAMDELIRTGHNLFIEIGAHPVLATSINECFADKEKKAIVLPSLRRKESENHMLLNSLGYLYCTGYPVNWKLLYTGEEHFVKLPCYAWQKDSYWHESDESKHVRTGLAEDDRQIHPLIGESINAVMPTWENEIDLYQLPYLKDHMVQGSVIYPGAAYIEMGIAVAKEKFKDRPCLLENIEIKAPLLSKENEGSIVQTVLEGDNIFAVYSQNVNKDWVNHIKGKIGNIKKESTANLDIDKIKKRCLKEEKKEDSYKRFHSLGLEYGEEFRSIEYLWLNGKEIIGEIKASNTIKSQLNDYWLHPAILDACFQVMASLPTDGTYLPVRIDGIKYFKRPSTHCFSYANVREQTFDKVKGDIKILDTEGKILVEVEGLECQYVEGTRKSKKDTIAGNLYEYQWVLKPRQEQQIIDSSDYMPSPGYIYEKVKKRMPELIKQYDRGNFYKVIEPKLDELCKEYFINALIKIGFTFDNNETFTTEKLADKFGVVKEHYCLFNRIFEILEQENILMKSGNLWKVLRRPEVPDPQRLWNKILLEHPDHEAELILIERCGSNLAGILQGESDPLAIIFPPGSLVAEHLYRNAPTFRIYNRLVQESVSIIIDSLPEEQTLRILEIGAGTGSLSSYILPMLPAHRAEYVFTDISASFTTHAQERFKDYGFIDYKVLNIEQDAVAQGFEPHSFDLILASDAIHATTNLKTTLNNVKTFLKDGGLLILLETTKSIRWFDIVFGTLNGWWLFSDVDIRPNHVLLSKDKWINLFKDNGFSEIVGVSDEIDGYETLHNVLISQASQPETAANVTKPEAKISLSKSEIQNRSWIILADNETAIADRLTESFKAKGIFPVIVKKGSCFKKAGKDQFMIRSGSKEDIEGLLNKVCNDSSLSPIVINMWELSSFFDNKMSCDLLKKITNAGCIDILYFIQALAKDNWSTFPSIKIITNGTQTVGGLKDLNLGQTPMWGIGRVLITEYPEWNNKIIDLSLNPSEEEIQALCEELVSDNSEDEVVLRGKKRYVHRMLKMKESYPLTAPKIPFSLCKVPTKAIDEFIFIEKKPDKIKKGEVKIQVKSTALNIRDFKRMTGLLDTKVTGNRLLSDFGGECSGIITAVGKGVEKFKAGDEVMGFVSNGCSNYTIANPQLLVHKPSNLSFEDSATIPESFVTAYYALHKLAKINKKDKIFILSASIDIGLAAIQIVYDAGGEVFATADTLEKRNLLLAMGIKYVADHNSPDFYNEMMQLTNGQGVDVILNNLPVKRMAKSISLLKPVTGRFIDISNSTTIEINTKGITFYNINLTYIKEKHPEIIEAILKTIKNKFDTKRYHALIHRVFPVSDIVNAFRCIKDDNRIGKVVLCMQDPGIIVTPTIGNISVNANATYLMTGGLGGFGLAVAKWLVECGARYLVLLGRSGDRKPEAKKGVQELRDMGAEVFVGRVDVTKEDQVKDVLSHIEKNMPPLKGIIHAAMVLEDAFLDQMTDMQLKKVMDPKILGAWNLHKHTLDKKLSFFISFSSLSSLIGNRAQGNYAAGNLFIDMLSHYRKAQGLPVLTICWGAIADVGYVAQHEEIKEHFQRQGIYELTLNQAWNVIRYGLEKKINQIGAMPVDWKKFSKYASAMTTLPRFSELFKLDGKAESKEDSSRKDYSEIIPLDSPEELKKYLTEKLARVIANVLGISVKKLNHDQALDRYGLDSLMAVELNIKIKEAIGADVPKMALLQKGINVNMLAEVVGKELLK